MRKSGSGRHPKTNGRARQRPVWVRRVGHGPTTTPLATKRRQWQWGRRGNATRAGRARRMRRWGGGWREWEGACPLQYLPAVVSRAVPGPDQGGRGGRGRGQADLARRVTRRPTRHSRRVCLCGGLVGRLRRVDPNRSCELPFRRGGRWARGHSSMGEAALGGDAGVASKGARTRPVSGKNSFPLLRPFLVVGVKREGVPVQIGPKRFARGGEAPHWADLGRAVPPRRARFWQNERTDSTRRRSGDRGVGEEMGHRGSPSCLPQYHPSLKVGGRNYISAADGRSMDEFECLKGCLARSGLPGPRHRQIASSSRRVRAEQKYFVWNAKQYDKNQNYRTTKDTPLMGLHLGRRTKAASVAMPHTSSPPLFASNPS